MSKEKIKCPVDGCDEEFADEAEAMVHMKEKHRDKFAPPLADQVQVVEKKVRPEPEPVPEANLGMIPPGMIDLLNKQMDARIEAALESYLPKVQEAVGEAMQKVVAAQAQAIGIPIPNIGKDGGVIPGSPVTPTGAALLQWITKGGGGGSTDMDALAKLMTSARAISDVMNPPSMWDRVMQNVVVRSLNKSGLLTTEESKALIEPPPDGK